MYRIFIGWDSREEDAYAVCKHTLLKHSSVELDITPLKKDELILIEFYQKTKKK